MPRTVINRSISFDPQLFQSMEKRRGRLLMQRSEYITRCILKDMMAGGDMAVEEVPTSLVQRPEIPESPRVVKAPSRRRSKQH